MKSYKDFISSRSVKSEPEVVLEQSQEPEILEVEELPNLLGVALDEKENHHEPMDPPNVLIMRRVSVRQYPNNQRVALYYVNKINKYVTVPYTAMQWSTGVAEEKNIIQQLADISTGGSIHFNSGEALYVTEEAAKQFVKLYESLSKENKKDLIEVAGRSKDDFLEVQSFANQF